MYRELFFRIVANLTPDSFFRIRGLNRISSIKYIYKTDRLYFIQIGANDGVIHDPINPYIKKYHWCGITVEPVEEYYLKLKETYKNEKGILFENSAICEKKSKKVIYKVKNNKIAKWFSGIASFNKDNMLRNKYAYPDIKKSIIKQNVKCITLNDLVKKYKVNKIDLLCIDVEGYEGTVIKQLPLLKIKPKVIYFEHIHLSSSELHECKKLLKEMDYTVRKVSYSINTIAILN